MTVKINVYNLVDYLLLLLMYMQLVILEFFGFSQPLSKFISICILLRVIFLKGKQWWQGIILSAGLIIIFLLGLQFGDSFNATNARSNFLLQLYSVLYTYYIVFLCKNRAHIIDTCLRRGFWIFNITMFANIVVLMMQIFKPYSIIAVVDESERISFYEDNISGLFQYSSVHVVCLFTIFVVLYNFSYIRGIKNKTVKLFIWILTVIMTIFSFYIAANSDNKAFFLLFSITLFLYWYSGIMVSTKRIMLVLILLFIAPLGIYILYTSNSDIRKFVDTIIIALSLGNRAIGSTERIAIIMFGLQRPSTWLVGTGFGSSFIYAAGYMGFAHFGQADLGSILILGGIWYLAIQIIFYFKSFCIVSNCKGLKNSRAIKLSIFVILLSVLTYTKCFTRTNVISSLLLIILVLRNRIREDRNQYIVKR